MDALVRTPSKRVTTAASAAYSAPENQEEDGARNGEEHTAQVEAGDAAEAEKSGQQTSDERTDDADAGGDRDPHDPAAARVISGHEELRDSPGNESEESESENSHVFPTCLVNCWWPAVAGGVDGGVLQDIRFQTMAATMASASANAAPAPTTNGLPSQ